MRYQNILGCFLIGLGVSCSVSALEKSDDMPRYLACDNYKLDRPLHLKFRIENDGDASYFTYRDEEWPALNSVTIVDDAIATQPNEFLILVTPGASEKESREEECRARTKTESLTSRDLCNAPAQKWLIDRENGWAITVGDFFNSPRSYNKMDVLKYFSGNVKRSFECFEADSADWDSDYDKAKTAERKAEEEINEKNRREDLDRLKDHQERLDDRKF